MESQNNGCGGKIVFLGLVFIVIVGIVAYALLHRPSDYELARIEALQTWDIALGVAWRIVAIAAGLVLLLGMAASVRAGVRWLDTRSRLIQPDPQTGQFPAVKVRRGEAVVDLNRLPDGKVMTGVLGGKTALLLTLFFRHVLGQDVPQLMEQPAIIVTLPDASPEQLQVTGQAQAVQALAAASRGATTPQAVQAAQAMLPLRRVERGLPPLLVEETQPREVQLLLEAGRRQWAQGDEKVVDVPTS